MHLVHIFEKHPPAFEYTKAGKAKWPNKGKLVLRAAKHFYECLDKKKDRKNKVGCFKTCFLG